MAVVFDPNKKEDESQESSGQSQQITNPGTVGASASQAQTPSSQPNQQGTSSGRFTNITNYLNANKNFNKQGGGLAGKVATNLSNEGEQINKNVANAVQSFNQQGQQQVNNIQQVNPLAQQAASDPTGVLANTDQANQIQQAVVSNYGGPTSLNDLQGKENQGSLQAQAKDLNTNIQQGQTENGRYNLLRTMFNKPSYTSGQQNLDNLLIQGNKDQLKQIQNTRQTGTQVNQNLNNNIAQAQQAAQNYTNQYNQGKQGIIDTLTGGISAQNQQAQENLARVKQTAQEQQSQLARDLASGHLTQSEYNMLGGANSGLNAGDYLYGVDPTKYLSLAQEANVQNATSADQYAKIQALNKLLGGNNNIASSLVNDDTKNILNQFSDPSKAGTYQPTFNVNHDLLDAINSAKQGYGNQVQQLEQEKQNNKTNTDLTKQGIMQKYSNLAYAQRGSINPTTNMNELGLDVNLHLTPEQQAQMNAEMSAADQRYQEDLGKYSANFEKLKQLLGNKLNVDNSLLPSSDFGATT